MTEHLPECLVPMNLDRGFWLCICRELRSCTERVIAAGDEQSQIAYETGYRHALDAAVQRVEAMDLHGCFPHRGPVGCNCIGPQVIAAIEALRKKSND